MDQAEFDPNENELDERSDPEPVIDLDDDVDVREEGKSDGPMEDQWPDDEERRIDNVDLDNAIDGFVDLLNARDFDGVGDLLAPDVEAELVGGTSREEVVEGFNDLLLRYPTLLTTRADVGSDPVVAVWTFDNETDRFDEFGFLFFEMSDTEGLVQRISYADELSDPDELIVETPQRSDLPEWEDWSELDED